MKRVLVIGCGSIGRRHAVNAARFGTVSVADVDSARAAAVAREIGAEVCETVEQGLAAKPDAVVVAVPHRHHLPLATAALKTSGDILIEKPLAASLAGVGDFLQAADAAKRRVRVVCNMRFHPAIAALRAALPMIGRPRFAQAHYGNYLPDMRPGADYRTLYCASAEAGGGVILDAIHEIDYLVWLFGGGRAGHRGSGQAQRSRHRCGGLRFARADACGRRAFGNSPRLSAALQAPRLRDRRQRGHAGVDQRRQVAGTLPGALLCGRLQRVAGSARSEPISTRRPLTPI